MAIPSEECHATMIRQLTATALENHVFLWHMEVNYAAGHSAVFEYENK
jgi:hypothetical protein